MTAAAVRVRGPWRVCGWCVLAVLVDPEGRTAAAYGMRVPADGGPPVGYAVVDDRTMVRYRTLDPHPAANSREIMTVLDAL